MICFIDYWPTFVAQNAMLFGRGWRPDPPLETSVGGWERLASSCHINKSTFPMLLGLARFSLFARRSCTGSRSLFSKAANILVLSFLGIGFSSGEYDYNQETLRLFIIAGV